MFKLVVLFSLVALAAAKPGYVAAPLAYSTVPAVNSLSQYSSSVVHGTAVVPPAVYNHVVSPVAFTQAPHSPAVVLDAVHGVPLDTPEVVAARAAHYQAKALSGYHHLRKRSAGLAYSSVVAPVAHSTVVAPVAYASPLAYSAPVVSAYSSPVIASPFLTRAYGVHPW